MYNSIFRQSLLLFDGYLDNCADAAFLMPQYPCEFNYLGEKWSSVSQAFNYYDRKDFTDKQRVTLMGNLLYYRFLASKEDAKKLQELKSLWIELKVTNHDNYWNKCVCPNCLIDESKNYYGRLLMEVRDRLIWENAPERATKKRWKCRYF